jgi:hypothetical protein
MYAYAAANALLPCMATGPRSLSLSQAGPVCKGFDLIMGSDILYERDEGGALAGYIARHAQLHCEVLMVDPNRGNRPAFSKHMAGLGFKLDDQPLRSLAHDTEKYSGHLLRYQR